MTGLLSGRRSITYRDDVTPPPSRRDTRRAVLADSIFPVSEDLPEDLTINAQYEIAVIRDAPYSRQTQYPLWRNWADIYAPVSSIHIKDVVMYVQDLGEDSTEAVLISLGGQLMPEQLRNLLCLKSFDTLPEDVRTVLRFGARWYWPVRFTHLQMSAAEYMYGYLYGDSKAEDTGRHHRF